MRILTYTKKFFFSITLLGYLTLSIGGFIHIAHMAEMNIPMENCPFSLGEHSLCEMNFVNHIQALQQINISLLASFSLLILLSIVFFSLYFKFEFLPTPQIIFYLKRERLRNYSLYQELFSQGILNPKAP